MSDDVPSCYRCKHYLDFTVGVSGFTRLYRNACRLTKHRLNEPENGDPVSYRSIKGERNNEARCGRAGKNFIRKPALWEKAKGIFR